MLSPAFAQPALKDAFSNTFRIGAALNPSHFLEENTNAVAIIKSQFNTISSACVPPWLLF